MKIVFLDFDGVLNSVIYDRERDKSTNTNIDESRVCLLKQIIDETNAKIVLSTSWRRHWDKNIENCDNIGVWINTIFSKFGLQIFDKTPYLSFGAGRKAEVLSWIEFSSEPIESYVILDDYALGWEELGDRLVKTSPYIGRGLEKGHVKKAIEILNNKIIRE